MEKTKTYNEGNCDKYCNGIMPSYFKEEKDKASYINSCNTRCMQEGKEPEKPVEEEEPEKPKETKEAQTVVVEQCTKANVDCNLFGGFDP